MKPAKSDNARYLDLLEQRLSLLGSLATQLAESRTDFVSLDLQAIERRLGEQVQFCTQIRSLDAEITSVQVRCAERAGVPPCTSAISWPPSVSAAPEDEAGQLARIHDALERLVSAQAEVKRLNDAHLSLLRRSRHTVNVLLNMFKSYEPTYAATAATTLPTVGTAYEERA